MAEEQSLVTITVEGLRRPSDDGTDSKLAQCEMRLNADAPISEIWTKIEELGYIRPDDLTNHGSFGQCWSSDNTKIIRSAYCEVTVVGPQEPSNCHHNTININDTLISFANQLYHGQSQLRFELQPDSDGAKGAGAQRLVVDENLEIVFHRTLRMPDDNRLHQLPASLGNFPLFNVKEYIGRLPSTIEEQGGIFFPMWQREAMWIGFHMRNPDPDLRYAVRIFVGRINAITGLPMNSTNEKEEDGLSRQDYVVVPGQPWVDGICVAAGVVRQFVAMPLGSGYSVEGQITSKEKFGGLQIEVIPSHRRHLKMWGLLPKPGEPEGVDYGCLPEYHTPAELGLKPFDKLRTYTNLQVPLKVSDLPRQKLSDKIRLSEPFIFWESLESVELGDIGYCRPPVVPEVPNSPLDEYRECALIDDRKQSQKKSVLKLETSRHQYLDTESSSPLSQNFSGFVAHTRRSRTKAAIASRERRNRDSSTHRTHRADNEPRTPRVERKTLHAMGLAAGGKMIQDINRDYNSPKIWNVQNATLLNVHILDPVSCEQVIHVIQDPPMNAQAYIDADLPFFVIEENVENRLDKGDFDQVISVSDMDKKVGVTTEPSFDPNKPKKCEECSVRLCDCIIRPCKHQFCNVCIRKLESITAEEDQGRKHWKCPRCDGDVHYVAGFSAPMNLPGEETLKVNVPVTVLRASSDGRPVFQSIFDTRI